MDAVGTGALTVRGVTKRFGVTEVLRDVGLELARGEFATLLGPSGCGKTTLLRIIAGLELADAGAVVLSGADITRTPANRRPVNMVFQQYALFPHLTVADNVAFGLRARRVVAADVTRRVADALALLRIDDLAGRRPDQLSGGQRQRVALARALVNEPQVLLLDEPLSALDAKLRGEVQVELRRLQRRLRTTFLLVTHDQHEAMSVSDRILVMDHGRIVQQGAPRELYERPLTRFVAEFLGAANLIPATADGGAFMTALGPLTTERSAPWTTGTLAIRPERIAVVAERPVANGVRGTVREVIYCGDHLDLHVEAALALRVRAAAHTGIAAGQDVWLHLPSSELRVLND